MDGSDTLCSIFSALSHFDPSQVLALKGLCFSRITEILDSSAYPADEQYQLAAEVVKLAWKQIEHEGSQPFPVVPLGWVLPLLRFLQLGKDFYSTDSRSAPGALALRILSNNMDSTVYWDLGPKMLPILTFALLPTHPLQSRRFLRAVGDPFQYAPDISAQDEQHSVTNEYEPMKAAAIGQGEFKL